MDEDPRIQMFLDRYAVPTIDKSIRERIEFVLRDWKPSLDLADEYLSLDELLTKYEVPVYGLRTDLRILPVLELDLFSRVEWLLRKWRPIKPRLKLVNWHTLFGDGEK